MLLSRRFAGVAKDGQRRDMPKYETMFWDAAFAGRLCACLNVMLHLCSSACLFVHFIGHDRITDRKCSLGHTVCDSCCHLLVGIFARCNRLSCTFTLLQTTASHLWNYICCLPVAIALLLTKELSLEICPGLQTRNPTTTMPVAFGTAQPVALSSWCAPAAWRPSKFCSRSVARWNSTRSNTAG